MSRSGPQSLSLRIHSRLHLQRSTQEGRVHHTQLPKYLLVESSSMSPTLKSDALPFNSLPRSTSICTSNTQNRLPVMATGKFEVGDTVRLIGTDQLVTVKRYRTGPRQYHVQRDAD